MGIEYELKYSADHRVQGAIRCDLGGAWVELRMRTTYYDTEDGALSSRKWTLRRRLENGRSVCTLKTPAAGPGRNEWEVDWETIETAPEKLCQLGAPTELLSLTAAGVVPVCGAAFTRLTSTIALETATVEVALDEGVLFSGDRQEPLCEVEVELKSGDASGAELFARKLSQTYGLRPESRSKFKRALALGR